MHRSFDTIALTGKPDDETVAEYLRRLAAHILSRGCAVLTDPSVSEALEGLQVEIAEVAEIRARADLMMAIGGDGTMLYATGRVMLEARVEGPDGQISGFALNDVVLQKRDTGRMIDFETWFDGRYVNTHAGDGLVVATPTGSTAYALSGGGPILHPNMDAIVMVPICPHTLSDRPLVVPADALIDIRVVERAGTHPEVTCDGRLLSVLSPAGHLEIRRAGHVARLIHPVDHDYFRILRSKLHWGRGSRDPGPRQCD